MTALMRGGKWVCHGHLRNDELDLLPTNLER